MLSFRSLLVCLLLALTFGKIRADDQQPSTTETKLREALRNTMLQARDAQNQIVTLQATQAQSDKDNADLKAKVEALTAQVAALGKQSAADRAASDSTITGLKSQITDLNGQIAKFTESLAAWKKDDAEKTALAANKEEARAQLAGQVITLQRLVDDREQKNLELFNTGNEILTRYEKFSLGEALSAKEPFIGLTRVKLQELVQDYRDKLLDHVITKTPPTQESAPAAMAKQDGPPKTTP